MSAEKVGAGNRCLGARGAGTVTPIDAATNAPGTPIPVGVNPISMVIRHDAQVFVIRDRPPCQAT